MKIALIAHAHFAIKQPFAGGLESHTYHFARELIRQGHDVTTYAKIGTDNSLNPTPTFIGDAHGGNSFRYDTAFKVTMKRIRLGEYDLIINNSLNHIPLALHTRDMPPMLTIFHTPPLPKMEKVLKSQLMPVNRTYVAVSELTARQWKQACNIPVSAVSNGIDASQWIEHATSATKSSVKTAVWSGRITSEKGTHIAIDACKRAGVKLLIAGTIYDKTYFDHEVMPRLDDNVQYLGHLDQAGLHDLYARADVALVTPLWAEPFGLVAVEALASGVPVAALPNGALPSIINRSVGALAHDDTPESLAQAIWGALKAERTECRAYVEANYTLEKMVDSYMKHGEALVLQTSNELTWQTYP